MRFDEHFLKDVLPEATVSSAHFPQEPRVSIDTRVLREGDIFVAVPGTRVDGHHFLDEALQKGASGLIIQEEKKALLAQLDAKKLKKICVVMVPDTLEALYALARAWRAQFSYPVVAITGSVGKTSTKKTINNILDVSGMAHYCSAANQNTRIGLAINMLQMRDTHQAAIFELGISKRGEMARLSDMLRPTIGVVTNIGHAHMEGLGSLQDIAMEKKDIFKYFTENSIGIVNGDQPLLANVAYTHPVIKFGTKTINQIQARKIYVSNRRISFVLKIYKNKYPVVLKDTHGGAVGNCLAASAVAHLLGVPDQAIVQGLSVPVVIAGRFECMTMKKYKGVVINDCYNANPESMKTSLLAFQELDTKDQKIAVLGDMLELGINAPFWHRQLGRFLRKAPSLNHVILVGTMVEWTKKTLPIGLTVEMARSWQEAEEKLQRHLDKESVILVKGSNGIGLSKLVDHITE